MSSLRKLLAFSLVFLLFSMSVPEIGFIEATVRAEGEPSSNELVFYVSPNGSDEGNPGTIDQPFRTIAKAQSAVRDAIAGGMTGNVTVYLREGIHYLENKICFNHLDSGRNGYTVQYIAYPGEEPVLDSGLVLTDWEKVDDNIYKSISVGSLIFGTMYEDNVRSHNARHPNKGGDREGYLTVAAMSQSNPYLSFHFREGDIPPGLEPGDGLEVEFWNGGPDGTLNWNTYVREVESIDYDQCLITLKGSNSLYEIGPGTRYYIRGSKLFLDAPGEFYLDRDEGAVYYWPRASSIDDAVIVAPRLVQMIEFKGTTDEWVRNMKLEGVTIRNSNYTATGIDGNYSMINVENAENVTIKDNHLYNAGRLGISLRGVSKNCVVSGNYLHEIGYNGIQVENSINNIVTNNYIHDVGTMFGHGCGIYFNHASNNQITHNRIHNSRRYGISIKSNTSANNLVQYNEVFNCNTDSQDTGVIELYMPGRGNIIDHNKVFDSNIYMSYGFGIYLDDNTSGTTVSNNLVYGLQQYGEGELRNVIFAKGVENHIKNNYIVNNNASIGPFRSSSQNIDLVLERNIFYNSGDTIFLFADWHQNRFASSEYHLLYNDSGKYGIGNAPGAVNFEQWRTFKDYKYDQLSKIANPKFMDEEKNDYRLRYDSPARELGIQEIDIAKIGLLDTFKYGDKTGPLECIYLISADGKALSYVSISSGETVQLDVLGRTVTGNIADLSSAAIDYSSSDPNIATVDVSGVITGISEGIATITATVTRGGKSCETFIHILVDDSLDTLNINIPRSQLRVGEKSLLHVSGESKLGALTMFSIHDDRVEVINYDEEVINIDEQGNITAHASGTATIEVSVMINGEVKTAQKTVEVYGEEISAYSPINPTRTSNYEGLNVADWLISDTAPGSWILFKHVDFENIIPNRVKIEAAVPVSHEGGTFEIRLDSPTGTLLGTVALSATGGWTDFKEQTAVIEGRVTGIHDVYIIFSESNPGEAGNIKWFCFYREPVAPADPWKVKDYGGARGTVDTLDGKYIIRSNGANIWFASDDFTFMYQEVDESKANNVSIIATVEYVYQTHPQSSSGVMIRDNEDADSFNVIARILPDGGLRFTYRNTDNPETWYIQGPNIAFPATLKLTRQGDLFTGYYLNNGEWVQFGQITAEMSGDILVGIGTFSHKPDAYTEAIVSENISIIEEETRYTLTVEANANGIITVDPEKDFYSEGEEVTITATPNPGYSFVRFTGASTSETSPTTIIMDGNKTIGAIFELVEPAAITALDLSKTKSLYHEDDEDGQVIVIGISSEGREIIAPDELEYTSSEPSVLTVDANGVMNIKNPGISIVTAKYTGSYGTIEGRIVINVYRDYMKKQDFEDYTVPDGETKEKIITDNPRSGQKALGVQDKAGYYGYDFYGPIPMHEKYPMMVGEIWFYDNGSTTNSRVTVSFGSDTMHKKVSNEQHVAFPVTLAFKIGVLDDHHAYYGYHNDPVQRANVGPGAVDLTGTPQAGTGYTGNATNINTLLDGQDGRPTVMRREGWHQVVCVVNGGYCWDNVGTDNGTITYYLDGIKVFEENYVPLNLNKLRGQRHFLEGSPYYSIYDDMAIYKYYLPEEEPVVEYTLTIETPANGKITVEPEKETYAAGETVTITATADPGYRFVCFTGASTAATSPITITMDADKTIGAIFEPVSSNLVELVGDSSVQEGQMLDVTVRLKGVEGDIYAEDIIISYDNALFEYVDARAAIDQAEVFNVYDEIPGEIRVFVRNDEAISGDLDLLTVTFKAKQVEATSPGNISIVKAELGIAPSGDVIDAGTDSITVEVINVDKSELLSTIATAVAIHDNAVEGDEVGNYPVGSKAVLKAAIDQAQAVADNESATQEEVDEAINALLSAIAAFEESKIQPLTGDLNGDGEVNVGDLAIVAYHYRKDSNSADWEIAKIADMNNDNIIDIMDLIAVVNAILGK